jgi:hypothetical protein
MTRRVLAHAMRQRVGALHGLHESFLLFGQSADHAQTYLFIQGHGFFWLLFENIHRTALLTCFIKDLYIKIVVIVNARFFVDK